MKTYKTKNPINFSHTHGKKEKIRNLAYAQNEKKFDFGTGRETILNH